MSRRALLLWAILLLGLLSVACRSTDQSRSSAAIATSGADSGQDDDAVGGAAPSVGGGYPSKVSVAPGESLNFHISNRRNTPYELTIYREGATRQLMATIPNVQTEKYGCGGKATIGCGWPVAATFTVPVTWPSGVYTVDIPRVNGNTYRLLFFVRERNPGTARILFLTSVNTYQAYNAYGGGSLYDTDVPKLHQVSFDRPYSGDGLGYYNTWERHFVAWAEGAGYPLAHATTYDLEFLPNLLTPYDVVVIAGHSEYWTWNMRQRVKAYVAGGGRFLNLSGNTMWWQVRFENNGRTMVGYKSWLADPVQTREGATDENWDYPIFDSSFLFTGLHWPYGGYPGAKGNGYYVVNADHWVYAGTGLAEDALFGKGPSLETSIHDKESDGLAFNCGVDGSSILGPIVGTGTPANFTILGLAPVNSHIRSMDSVAVMGIYTTPSGGAVFSAGTTGWVRGLDQPAVDRITRNILDRFLSASVPPEPAAADADVLFRDRFNCLDLDHNRGSFGVGDEDGPKLNYVQVNDGNASRLTAACGQSGSGLSLRVDNGARYITNLKPDWSSLAVLRARAYLNLSGVTVPENSTIDLFHHYFDDRRTTPVLAAVLQLGRRNGQLAVRYQPSGQNQSWIPVPADRFFLLETKWDTSAGRAVLLIDGQQRASEPLPSAAARVNRADLGTIVVNGNAGGAICVDELVYDGTSGPPPTPSPTPTPTRTPSPTPTPTLPPTLTPTVTNTPPPGATLTPTPTATPPPIYYLYLSFIAAGMQDGVSYQDEDILRLRTQNGKWTMYFDGSDVGLAGVDVDAFAMLADGSLLLSVDAALAQLAGVGPVAAADVLRFVPSKTGANTAGQFSLYLQGADLGLDTAHENIDALAVLPDGRLLVSTLGNFRVGTGAQELKGKSHDLLALTVTQTGSDSAGQWALYFDGSDVKLTTPDENLDAVWAAAGGALWLSTSGAALTPTLAFGPSDVAQCVGAMGNATTCTFALAWAAAPVGLAAANVDGVHVVP